MNKPRNQDRRDRSMSTNEAAPLVEMLARALLIVDDEDPGILSEIAIDDTAAFPAAVALNKALVHLLSNGRWEARELRTARLAEGTDR